MPFLSENSVLLVLILGAVLLMFSLGMNVYISVALLKTVQQKLNRIESSQTTQEQYMYMMRGDIGEMNGDLTHFFVVNGYENLLSTRRREELARQRSRDPPSAGGF